MECLDINTLRARSGLRLVIVRSLPSPWGQAAKAMIEYKRLDYAVGLHTSPSTNEALMAWAGTNTNNAPVVAWQDEPPVNRWLDIVHLLERLAPNRPLLPSDSGAAGAYHRIMQ